MGFRVPGLLQAFRLRVPFEGSYKLRVVFGLGHQAPCTYVVSNRPHRSLKGGSHRAATFEDLGLYYIGTWEPHTL